MSDDTRLDPAAARARFGELVDPVTGTHRTFETPDGVWHPEFNPFMTLLGYRLHPPVRRPKRP